MTSPTNPAIHEAVRTPRDSSFRPKAVVSNPSSHKRSLESEGLDEDVGTTSTKRARKDGDSVEGNVKAVGFLSLPIELRDMVYKYTIIPELGHINPAKYNGKSWLAIMRVNKQISEEIKGVLRGEMDIVLTFWDLPRWESAWREARRQAERRLDIPTKYKLFREILIEDDGEVRFAINVDPILFGKVLSKFRNIKINIPIGSAQFQEDIYERALLGLIVNPTHESKLLGLECNCIPFWFKYFCAAQQQLPDAYLSSHVDIKWDFSGKTDYWTLKMLRQPTSNFFTAEDVESIARIHMCSWMDYQRGITYLTKMMRSQCPDIRIIDEYVSDMDGFIITHEVIDEKTVSGTFAETAVFERSGKWIKSGKFKFINLQLVEFEVKWA